MDSEERSRKNRKQLAVGFTVMILVISTAVAASLGIEQMFTGLITSVSNILASIGLPEIPAIPALGTLVSVFIGVALWDAVKATAKNRDKIKGSVQKVLESEDKAEFELDKAQSEVEKAAEDAAERGDISRDDAESLITNAEATKKSAEQMKRMVSEMGKFSLDTEDKTEELFSLAVDEAEEASKQGKDAEVNVRNRVIRDFKSGNLGEGRAKEVMDLLDSERKQVLDLAEEITDQIDSVEKEIDVLQDVGASADHDGDKELLDEVDQTLRDLKGVREDLVKAESEAEDLASCMESAEVGIRNALESER